MVLAMKIKLISTCCGQDKEYEVNDWNDYMAGYLKLLFIEQKLVGDFNKDIRMLIKLYNDTYGHKRRIEIIMKGRIL
jgi:hypothetical protein